MRHTHYRGKRLAGGGQALYDEKIRAQVETPENLGKIVVINIETGDFDIDQDGLTANKQALARNPDGAFDGVRVGYEAVESLGGGGLRRGKQ